MHIYFWSGQSGARCIFIFVADNLELDAYLFLERPIRSLMLIYFWSGLYGAFCIFIIGAVSHMTLNILSGRSMKLVVNIWYWSIL